MDVLIGAAIMLVGVFIGVLLTVVTYKTLSQHSEVVRPHVETLSGLTSQGVITPNEARDFMGYEKHVEDPRIS